MTILTPPPTDPSIHSYSSSTAPPPYYESYYAPSSFSPLGETTPLIRVQINRSQEDEQQQQQQQQQQQENKQNRGPNYSVGILVLLILLLLAPLFASAVVLVYRHFSTDILDPSVRDRIRHEWRADEVRHYLKIEQLRREWRADEAKHNLTIGRLRLEEEELEREIIDRRRQEVERERKEKAEREAMKLYWTDLEGEYCVSHGVRKYHARLANFHRTIDSNVACKATPIVINGETHLSPDHCKDDWSIIYGYWEVKDDPACNTYWDGLWDKGCTAPGSGYRRFESKLNGVKQGDDGPTMCVTTPVTVLHQHFDHPMACSFLKWPLSYYQGVWEVLDSRCS